MFKSACVKNRESIYGVRAFSQINSEQVNNTTGSGFTIAPGMLITVAHLVHVNSDFKKPIHKNFEVIRSPDIGQRMEPATFVAEDPINDIALLKINNSRSSEYLTLEHNKVPMGTNCGSLGFPLSEFTATPQGNQFNLVERFQGSYISSFNKNLSPRGMMVYNYEIDSEMYNGSSGCPGFLIDSKVIGMQSESRLSNNPAFGSRGTPLSISLWVPSMEIIKFAKHQGIDL